MHKKETADRNLGSVLLETNSYRARLFLMILLSLSLGTTGLAQSNSRNSYKTILSKYTGKYEANGMAVQIALIDSSLVLIVPGAPFQEMKSVGVNKFKTDSFSDEVFLFVEKDGKIKEMISERPGQSLKFNKSSDNTDDFKKADSLLVLKKSTRHFTFLYGKIDSNHVDPIARKLESDYNKILTDLKVDKIPVTVVRIYPDMISFHQGINFPNAPENILATAFGKNDFRMVSPGVAGLDSTMLMKAVAHEFTHCVHLNIDYAPNNPRWLWEGVAMFESEWFFDPVEIDFIKNKNFPSLASLNNGMEYMLGYVIIESIRDIWGFDAVINLIKKRGDVRAVLQLSENEFEQKVFGSIYTKYIKKTANQ